MKRLAFSFVVSFVVFSHDPASAQTIERSQLASANLGAPLPISPYGKSSFPYFATTAPWHQQYQYWGYGSPVGLVIPSIAFGVDDDKGAPRNCLNNTFNKHLGTDYAAPAGTNVYAIADGTIKRMNGFTGVGDYYVVVESGVNEKWTTLYGHLNKPLAWPLFGIGNLDMNKPIKKGELIGTIFDFRTGGDIPHLHLGIRLSEYVNVGSAHKDSSTRGYACLEDANYQLNKYKFRSPETLRYYTQYY